MERYLKPILGFVILVIVIRWITGGSESVAPSSTAATGSRGAIAISIICKDTSPAYARKIHTGLANQLLNLILLKQFQQLKSMIATKPISDMCGFAVGVLQPSVFDNALSKSSLSQGYWIVEVDERTAVIALEASK